MWVLRLISAPCGMPESAVIIIDGKTCLVTALIAIRTYHLPSRLADEERERIIHLRTIHHTVNRTIGCHCAGLVMQHRSRVFLVLTAVDAVIDGSVLGCGSHLDATRTQAFYADGLTNRHINASSLSSFHILCHWDNEETERSIGSFQLVFLHHVRTARVITQSTSSSIEVDD